MLNRKMNLAIGVGGSIGLLVGLIYLRQRTINELTETLVMLRERVEIQDEFLAQIANQLDEPVVITHELADRMKFFEIVIDNDLP